jgi:hypothetical protein
MKFIYLILLTFLTAGCVQLPPTPQDVQAKRFETVPDKAVIYVVRPVVDSHFHGALSFPGGTITTFQGTYFRWEAAPGVHRIEGAGASTAAVTIQAEAGKIYFVEHTVYGSMRGGLLFMALRHIGADRGRKMVNEATLM